MTQRSFRGFGRWLPLWLLKAVHAQAGLAAAQCKPGEVVSRLHRMRLGTAADLVEAGCARDPGLLRLQHAADQAAQRNDRLTTVGHRPKVREILDTTRMGPLQAAYNVK